jgi:hypothetical protein
VPGAKGTKTAGAVAIANLLKFIFLVLRKASLRIKPFFEEMPDFILDIYIKIL